MGHTYRSVVLFLLAWPLTGLGIAIAEGGAEEAVVLLVPAGALIAAAGMSILRDRRDIVNHVKWGWSTVGQGRQAGVFAGLMLAGLGFALLGYGAIAAGKAFAGAS